MRSPRTQRIAVVRWSLLASLALVPLACSSASDDGPSNAGSAGKAGSPTAGSSGSGATDGGAGGSGTGGEGPHKPPQCSSPQLEALSGVTTCAEGYSYRGKAVACALRGDQVARGETGQGGAAGGGAGDDAPGGAASGGAGDGTAPIAPHCLNPACDPSHPHEFCASVSGTPPAWACVRGCTVDADCLPSELCLCGESGGICHPADCRSDDDCGAGYHCSQVDDCAPFGQRAFKCQKAADECFSSKDCDGSLCGFDLGSTPADHRTCQNAACGE